MSTVDASGAIHGSDGKFAGHVAGEAAEVSLRGPDGSDTVAAPVSSDWRELRARQLDSLGYVAPIATSTRIDPKTTEGIDQWWSTTFVDAEYGHGGGDYPLMPDDNTPNMTAGQSISGNRRTHRMSYSGHGVTLRMPSKTAIHRFSAAQHDRTFDVPVSASLPDGRMVHGTVRVTKGSDGQWETKGLGFAPEHEVFVAEGVSAVLEGQRARTSLAAAGDLVARRRERLANTGAKAMPVQSTWIRSVGYGSTDSGEGMMTLTTKGYTRKDGSVAPPKTYGYKVDPATYAAMANSDAPGKVFNRFVRGERGVTVDTCGKCGLMTASGADHHCPTREKPRSVEDTAIRGRQRERAALVSRIFRRRN